MGFEFKITVSLSESEKAEIREILMEIPDQKKDYSPLIEIQEDGIYVCKFDKPDLWLGLDKLHNLLVDKKLHFIAEEL